MHVHPCGTWLVGIRAGVSDHGELVKPRAPALALRLAQDEWWVLPNAGARVGQLENSRFICWGEGGYPSIQAHGHSRR